MRILQQAHAVYEHIIIYQPSLSVSFFLAREVIDRSKSDSCIESARIPHDCMIVMVSDLYGDVIKRSWPVLAKPVALHCDPPYGSLQRNLAA